MMELPPSAAIAKLVIAQPEKPSPQNCCQFDRVFQVQQAPGSLMNSSISSDPEARLHRIKRYGSDLQMPGHRHAYPPGAPGS